MIKLKDILKEIDAKNNSVLKVPKGQWVEVGDEKEKEELKQNFYDLIANAYKEIGGHHDFSNPDDVLDPSLTFWKAADTDPDPEADVLDFGKKTKYGIKHTGLGHDGEKSNIKKLLKAKSEELKQLGHYAEVSGKAFDSYVGQGKVDVVDDEQIVRKILAKYDIEWHGVHPTDSSKSGSGWYTRVSGSGKKFTKTLVGMPRI